MDCYSERVDEALSWVAHLFRGVWRKGGKVPYLAHLMQVAVWVAEYGGDEDLIIGALLHDVVEDIPEVTVDDVEHKFGPDVARTVMALSDRTTEPKPPWKERKVNFIRRVRDENAGVKLICTCDKLHNCRSLIGDLRTEGPSIWERFSVGADESLWYYRETLKALQAGWEHPALLELARSVEQLEELITRGGENG